MELNICPLADDWGTVADWVAVFASSVLGFAVYWLARRTHQVSEQAVSLSQSAVELQAESERKRAEHDRGERALLLIRLLAEITEIRDRLGGIQTILLRTQLGAVVPDSDWGELVRILSDMAFPSADIHFDRLHVVGNPEAAMIVRLAGVATLCKGLAAQIESSPEHRHERFDPVLRLTVSRLKDDANSVIASAHVALRDLDLAVG